VVRSSSCSGASATVVEVATTGDQVRVRDGKDPDGPVLCFRRDEWRAFEQGARIGEFSV